MEDLDGCREFPRLCIGRHQEPIWHNKHESFFLCRNLARQIDNSEKAQAFLTSHSFMFKAPDFIPCAKSLRKYIGSNIIDASLEQGTEAVISLVLGGFTHNF
uniref:Uncharacterized protein n=1 Tax=Salix viminalis TaxID=40686 RepID=A0A6N2KHS4_SALVM